MNGRIFFLILSVFLFPGEFFAQTAPPTKFWIQFTDKTNSPFSITDPSAFVSQRAIDRRTKQGISFTEEDLPVNPSYLDSLRSKGAVILNPSKWLNGTTVLLKDTATSPAIIDAISTFPFVSHIASVKRLAAPSSGNAANNKFNESFFSSADGTGIRNYNYGKSYNQVGMIDGDILHSLGYRGKGKVIAVLDAGFQNADHVHAFDSLRAGGQILGTWDFVENNSSVYEDFWHGEEVLSIIGTNLPGTMIGTAPDASFWLLRSEDAYTENIIEEYNWVSAAEFADSVGADIISSSLGYSTFDHASQNHSLSDMDGKTTPCVKGAEAAFRKGILVVNSAGNEGSTSWKHLITPADGNDVIAVGAVDSARHYASFSSQGPSWNGIAVKPNVATQGLLAYLITPQNQLVAGNGTSFACPVLSGMAACLWQAAPESTTNAQLKYAIEQSADHFRYPDNYTGYGIPDFSKALYFLKGKTVSDFTEDKILAIYSNPFTTSFSFNFFSFSKQEISISLFDVIGRKVLDYTIKTEASSFQIITVPESDDAARLVNGVYFLNVHTLSGNHLVKMIKI